MKCNFIKFLDILCLTSPRVSPLSFLLPSSLSHLISLQSSISLFKNLNSVELSGKMKISFPFPDTNFESEEIQQEFKEF